jgi:hypothetical protein
LISARRRSPACVARRIGADQSARSSSRWAGRGRGTWSTICPRHRQQ